MKHCPDNNDSSKGDSGEANNSDNDNDNGSGRPPRKKARTLTEVNDNFHLSLPRPEIHADNNEGTFINAILLGTNKSTDPPQPNSDVPCMEDIGSLSHHGTALKDPLYVATLYHHSASPRKCQFEHFYPT